MDKTNIPRFLIQGKTSYHMPTRMTIVTLAAFSGTDSAFDFKASDGLIIPCIVET
jgi:hypothetical protein